MSTERRYYEKYWQRAVLGASGGVYEPPTSYDPMMPKLVEFFRPYLRGSVLDVGCGAGDFVEAIRELPGVEYVVGLDVSKTAISLARRRYPQSAFLVAEVLEVPFPTEAFDVILVREVVEHILDSSGMFCELSRCLRGGGYLGITTTDYNLPKKFVIALLWDRYFYPDNPHIRFYTKKTLASSLRAVGCQVVKHEWNGSHFGIMPWGQRVIARK